MYCQEVPYVLTILMILIVLSTVYRQFSFLRTVLAASVDISRTKFIFASYFSMPISLQNPRNILIRSFFTYSVTISYILHIKIVLYSIYAIMYVHGNQFTQTMDHRPQITDGHTLNLPYSLMTISVYLLAE